MKFIPFANEKLILPYWQHRFITNYVGAYNELNATNFKTDKECFYHEEEEKRIKALERMYEITQKGVNKTWKKISQHSKWTLQ